MQVIDEIISVVKLIFLSYVCSIFNTIDFVLFSFFFFFIFLLFLLFFIFSCYFSSFFFSCLLLTSYLLPTTYSPLPSLKQSISSFENRIVFSVFILLILPTLRYEYKVLRETRSNSITSSVV